MAINQGSEFLHDEPRFISQKYRDLTFLFGPPSGERYEMLATGTFKAEFPRWPSTFIAMIP